MVTFAGDNAATKSLRALRQRHVLEAQSWSAGEDLPYTIVHWIEHTHNRRGRRLGRPTPVACELAFT